MFLITAKIDFFDNIFHHYDDFSSHFKSGIKYFLSILVDRFPPPPIGFFFFPLLAFRIYSKGHVVSVLTSQLPPPCLNKKKASVFL